MHIFPVQYYRLQVLVHKFFNVLNLFDAILILHGSWPSNSLGLVPQIIISKYLGFEPETLSYRVMAAVVGSMYLTIFYNYDLSFPFFFCFKKQFCGEVFKCLFEWCNFQILVLSKLISHFDRLDYTQTLYI